MSETQETTEIPTSRYGMPAEKAPDTQTSEEVKAEQESAKKSFEETKAADLSKTPATGLKEEKKRDVSLTANRLKQAEFTRTIYTATVERGHSKTDLLDPKYWAHIAIKLKRGDRIEVMAEDGSYFAELMVIACERTWAQVHILHWHDLNATTVQMTPEIQQDYLIDFKGPERWCVIRRADNAILQSKLNTEGEAKTWLEGFVRNRSAA